MGIAVLIAILLGLVPTDRHQVGKPRGPANATAVLCDERALTDVVTMSPRVHVRATGVAATGVAATGVAATRVATTRVATTRVATTRVATTGVATTRVAATRVAAGIRATARVAASSRTTARVVAGSRKETIFHAAPASGEEQTSGKGNETERSAFVDRKHGDLKVLWGSSRGIVPWTRVEGHPRPHLTPHKFRRRATISPTKGRNRRDLRAIPGQEGESRQKPPDPRKVWVASAAEGSPEWQRTY